MHRPLRVLIIEDSEDDAELLLYELERHGYDPISERVDTPVAMNASLNKQQWDIVIADYTLPNFSAPAALNLLKKRALDLPFIIVSGTIGEDIAVAAMKAGAHDYLMKGKLARLAPAVERELREASERHQRRVAERTIRQNEERFRLLIENALDIITVLGIDGLIQYESPAIEKVLGYKPEDLVGKNILEYIHPEDVGNVLNILNQVVQKPKVALSVEFRFQHQDGSWRILEAVGQKFTDSLVGRGSVLPQAISSIVLNSRDITERKRAEEIRHALEKERELSEGRFKFVSMMSHEFRNPLTTIMMSSELVKNFSDRITPEQKTRCLNQIGAAAKEMTQLLDDILSIAKVEVGKLVCNPQIFDLEEFCHNLLEEMRITSTNRHRVTLGIRGECQQVCMDENLLRHILRNLLSNAIKYSPQGGNVRLDVSCDNEEVVFQIQDEGIGISVDDQQKLFESFHRGENVNAIPGTGLGLCIVKKYVDLHGGKIALKSAIGVGSTFTATLPLKGHHSIGKQHNEKSCSSV